MTKPDSDQAAAAAEAAFEAFHRAPDLEVIEQRFGPDVRQVVELSIAFGVTLGRRAVGFGAGAAQHAIGQGIDLAAMSIDKGAAHQWHKAHRETFFDDDETTEPATERRAPGASAG